jgi:hypothetical protein
MSLFDRPAMMAPDGVDPEFDNPPNRNTMVIAIITVCLVISSIAVTLRVYSRYAILGKIQIQDYLLLISFALYISIIVLYYRLVHNPGWFVHQWNLRLGGLVEFLHVGIVTTCLFLAMLISIKTAILVEWIRIFLPASGHRRSIFYWACHFMIWSNIVFCFVTMILVNLSCVPYEYLWNRTIPGGYCRINTAYTSLSAACFALATDFIILLIPQRIIWTLNMSTYRRLGVSLVFTLGVAACAAAIVRLYNTVQRSQSTDLSWQLSTVQLTALGEGACVILVMCVPAIPKALTALGSSRLSSPIRSWNSMVSFLRHRPSQQSMAKNNNHGYVQTRDSNVQTHAESGSERNLVPLAPLPSLKAHDPEHGTITRSTQFQANAEYALGDGVSQQERIRQHPWMGK